MRVLLAWMTLIAVAHGQDLTPKPTVLDSVGVDQKLGAAVPVNLAFRNEQGSEVALARYLRDKPVILVPAYYECPMLCTQILNGLLSGLRPLSLAAGSDFLVVIVSIDPEESPALAAAKKVTYVEGYGREGGSEGWHFLTGDRASIHALTHAMGYRYLYDPETDEYIHASAIAILTPRGKIARYLFGVEFAPRDLQLGLLEATRDEISSPIDAVLLYCFQYNPLTGKYTLAIYRLVRIAGAITVICILAFVFAMVRRERSPLQAR